MLFKLALKNVGKSFKDYAIYFFTLVFAVCIFYLFNSIYAQSDIMKLTESMHEAMKSMTQILGMVSLFVAVILGFLIIYANRFFIKRRKKELGVYMTLGMNKGKISTILVLETSVVAVFALVVGLICGVFGAQFMSVFTAKLFEADMSKFTFVFAPDAILKSILCFGIIFIVVIIFNTLTISKLSLLELLDANRRNETWKNRKVGIASLNMITSICLIGMAYILILKNGILNVNLFFFLSIILGTVGTFLFFFSLADILTRVIQSKPTLYYKDLNIVILRQMSSKMNTNYITMSIVCIVLLLAIGIFSTGYSLQNVLSRDLKNRTPFDVSYFDLRGADTDDIGIINPHFGNLIRFLDSNDNVKDYEWHGIYTEHNLNYGNLGVTIPDNLKYMKNDRIRYIKLSDYNRILVMQGEKEINLLANQYGIVIASSVYEGFIRSLIRNKTAIRLNDQELFPSKNIQKVLLSNNPEPILFIVNDEFVEEIDCNQIVLNLNCKEEAAEKFEIQRKEFLQNHFERRGYGYSISKVEMYEQIVSSKAIISFLAIYLGIVFMMTATAILAIQQLSETTDHKERFELLRKLGAEERDMKRALFIQILCYFLFPLLLAVVHSMIGLKAANQFISLYGDWNLAGSIIMTVIFIIFVYGGYFALTFYGAKNIIKSKDR